MRYSLDSENVDHIMNLTLGERAKSCTWLEGRGVLLAFLRARDMASTWRAVELIIEAQDIIAAWRAPVEPTPNGAAVHTQQLAKALAVLEAQLAKV